MARTVVTDELIVKMNELYLSLGTYAGVSRALGGSPSPTTVKKYIIPNYVPQAQKNIEISDIKIPELDTYIKNFEKEDLDFLYAYTPKEYSNIIKLWEEIDY